MSLDRWRLRSSTVSLILSFSLQLKNRRGTLVGTDQSEYKYWGPVIIYARGGGVEEISPFCFFFSGDPLLCTGIFFKTPLMSLCFFLKSPPPPLTMPRIVFQSLPSPNNVHSKEDKTPNQRTIGPEIAHLRFGLA